MNARTLLRRPSWLPRSLDNTYYVGANAFTERVWDTIFNNLSKYPKLGFGDSVVSDHDTRVYICQRLACLLPDSNYQYSRDQVAVWMSLMTSPLTVSSEALQKVVAMEEAQFPSVPEGDARPKSRGFFMYSWTMLVSEFDTLVKFFKDEERTVHELVAWDDFIAAKKLGPTDQIFIRYIGSCAVSEWPAKPLANIYDETEDARSGILADFVKALLTVLPGVAATCQCYLIQHITTSAEDEEGLHEFLHSILIEFFGASFVLNRHLDSNLSKWPTKRDNVTLANLDLQIDNIALEPGLWCPTTTAATLQYHFNRVRDFIIDNPEVPDLNHGEFELDETRNAALLDQSMSRCYKRSKAISEEHSNPRELLLTSSY